MTREQRLLEALSPLTEAEKAAVLEAAELNGSLTTDAVIGAMAFKKYHAAPDEGPDEEKIEKAAKAQMEDYQNRAYEISGLEADAFRQGVEWRDQNPKSAEGPGDGECDCGSERQGHVGEHLSGCPAARAHTPKGKPDLETYEFDKSKYIKLPSFTPKGQGAEFPEAEFELMAKSLRAIRRPLSPLDAAKWGHAKALASRPKAEGRERWIVQEKGQTTGVAFERKELAHAAWVPKDADLIHVREVPERGE